MYSNRKKRKSNYDKRSTNSLMVVVIAVGVLILTVCGVTVAKYVMEKRAADLAEVASFYLSSDYLRPEKENAQYDIYGSAFDVQLFNIEHGNLSEVDIDYTITVENGTASPSSGTIVAGDNVASETITITPTDTTKPVIVTANATFPYTKTLTAVFLIKQSTEGSKYRYEDKGVYGILTINTGSSVGDITVNYGPNLAPHNGETLMATWLNETSGMLSNLQPNSTYTLTFFENDPTEETAYTKTGTITDGTITIGD